MDKIKCDETKSDLNKNLIERSNTIYKKVQEAGKQLSKENLLIHMKSILYLPGRGYLLK